ncbi:MAG: TRAP transporter substrate-binding protein [Lentisphaerales bacterium]|nr:TRAP transporter substrate-binding protein [Lentisphaerales bacterium]
MNQNKNGFLGGILIGILLSSVIFAFVIRSQRLKAANSGQQKTVIKLAHSMDMKHPVHLGMIYMKQRLEEISGGAATLDIVPGGVLGNETKCIEMLQSGTLAMTKTSASPMEGFVPEMGVFSLPYIFRDRDHYWQTLDSNLGKDLLQKAADKKIRGLCYYDAGSRNFYTKEKPIMRPEDLTGQKIRVMNSKTAIDMVKALGGAPTPISWGELYSALNQGVVDGAENNPPSYYTNGHHKICKYLSMDEHTMIPDLLVVSEKVWQSYPDQLKVWIQQAADDSSLYQRKLWQEKTTEALEAASKDGVEVSYPDKKPFMDKTKVMIEALQGTPVEALYQRIQEVK